MRCFILGNGPSLAKIPNDFLDYLPTFGSNRIYLKYTPTYYACINTLIAEQSRKEIDKLESVRFVTNRIEPILRVFPLVSNSKIFSFSPLESIYEGGTVTCVLFQLAYWLGFTEIYLLGVDHKYEYSGDPNEEIIWNREDINHFSSNYMREGEKWNCPDLEASEASYREIKSIFDADGRSIINLTHNSALNIFPKGDLVDYMEKWADERSYR